MKHKNIVITLQALCWLCLSTTVAGVEVTTANEDVLKRMAIDYRVQSLDGAAIGEQIGLQRGSLTFKTTDLQIKGNGPDIVIARTYKGENYSYHHSLDMADWSFDIPHIYTTVVKTMGRNTSGPWGKYKACSETIEPETMYYNVSGTNLSIEPNQFHNGDFLFSHESGTENLYEDSSAKFGAAVSRITKSNWKFECFQFRSSEGQAMEGFIGYSPSGLKYTFNQPIRDRTKTGSTFGAPVTGVGDPLDPLDSNSALNFHAKYLYVSKIEDRFGRAIEYRYDGNKLTAIVATDGRKVELEYDPAYVHRTLPLISAIKYGGRRISYTYAKYPAAVHTSLVRADIGENLFWQYQLHELSEYYPDGETDVGGQNQCARTPLFSGGNGAYGHASIRHPAGFKVRYELKCTYFGRASVPPKVDTLDGKRYITPYSYGEISITKKTLEYDSNQSYSWSYQYSGNTGFSTDLALTDIHRVKGVALPAGINPALVNATTVTNPDGSTITAVYDRSFTSPAEGSLLFEATRDQAGNLISTSHKKYGHARAIGWDGVFFENSQVSSYAVAVTENITQVLYHQQPSSYRTQFSDFDIFGRPGKKAEYSADESRVKFTKNTYFNDLTHWVIGQPASTAISDNDAVYLQTEEYKYHPEASTAKSSLMEYWDYQRKIYSLDYQVDGNVSRKTYNLANRWVSYQNYYLGSPKRVEFPDRYDAAKVTAVALEYDAFGNVTQATDFNANTTNYQYDNIGRLKLIDPVSASIANTTIRYDVLDSYRTQQSVEKGNYRLQGIYDGLRRAILTSEWDATNEWSTRKQQFKAYDENHKVVFQSQFLTDAHAQSPGTRSEYDALGRLDTVLFPDGHRETYEYLSGHEIRFTNANGHAKTTTYLALGSPAYDLPLSIAQPENITTTLTYNVAGYPTNITQGGYSETRVYDNKMQLCLKKRPETGIKALQYNALGQVTKYAEGLAGNGRSCQDYTNVAANWVTTVYDHHGDQHQLNFADGSSPNKLYQLDPQGNLQTLTAGGTVWSYTYNAAHQPETETLNIDGKSYVIDPAYNSLGHLNSLRYGGSTLEFLPNALGQPTLVREGSTTYASNVSFYPSGQARSFSYGNGVSFNQTLDEMQRPLDMVSAKGGQNRTAYSYRYDGNHNLSDIFDLTNSSKNIKLTYDNADRLKTASGSWGAGDFNYDSAGNLLAKNLGTQRLSYDYDPVSKRLRSVSGGNNYLYDDRGNVTNNGFRNFQFNRANQLISSGTVSYIYDGYNRRVKKTADSASYSIYDKNGQLLLTDGSQGVTRYIYLGPQLIARVGNTAAIEDKPGYTGHLEDDDLQLTYMQQRYYDPVIGRFYSNDPVGFSASNPMMFNRYAYANNNPYRYTDPDGRSALVLEGIKDGVIIGGSAGGPWGAVGGGIVGGLIGAGATYGIILLANDATTTDSVTDRSGQAGTSEDVQGFKDDLDGVSSPQSDNPKVRILRPGIKVKDVMDKAPGIKGENGRKQTENGNIGTHGSSSTQDKDGKNVETLSVKEGNNVRKYRESTD